MFMKSKMTNQLIARACVSMGYTAATTAQATSEEIDRLGFNTAYFVLQGMTRTAAASSKVTATLYQTDVSTGTYTLITSATISGAVSTTFTFNLTPTSAATTITDKMVNLSGLNRFLKVYLAITGGVTNTITASVICILGDANVEPTV